MKDYESGFLALILTGILVLIISLGLVASAVRSPNSTAAGIVAQGTRTPSTRTSSTTASSSLLAMLGVQPADGAALPKR